MIKNESVICTRCLHELPLTHYYLHNDNPVKKVFYGRIDLKNATALRFCGEKAYPSVKIQNKQGDREFIWGNGWAQN